MWIGDFILTESEEHILRISNYKWLNFMKMV